MLKCVFGEKKTVFHSYTQFLNLKIQFVNKLALANTLNMTSMKMIVLVWR